MWDVGVACPDVRRTKLSEGIMITPEVARAHIDELHRVAAQYHRAAAVPSVWRRLLTRHIRHS
jgi:hypothetical protein